MIGGSVKTFLLATSSITALVGNRIVPNYATDTLAYPQIVYECKNAKSDADFDGSGNPYTLELNLTCIGERSYADADAVAQAVVTACDGFSGMWGSTKILGCFLDDATEDQVVEPNSEAILFYLKEITFTVVYEL